MKEIKNKKFSGDYDITVLKDLESLVLQCISILFPKNFSNDFSKTVFWLEGPLGIGKSEWVRLFLKHLGYKNNVPSPSFSFHHFYEIDKKTVDHVDLYRVTHDKELESIGFFDLFLKKEALVFIEWANRLKKDLLPQDWNKIYLHFKWKNSKRKLHVQSDLSMF